MAKKTIKAVSIAALIFVVSCGSPAKRGYREYDKQNYPKAVAQLEAAEKAGDKSAQLYFKLGASYFYLNRFEEAVKYLGLAAKDDKDNFELMYLLGNAYYNLGKFEDAADSYRKAIEIKTDYLDAIEALAMLYTDGAVSKREACGLWRRALDLETRDEWITRANHYMEKLSCDGTN